jgi:hypothetical protein
MAHYSPLGEAATTTVEVENIDEAAVVDELERAFRENPAASDDKNALRVRPLGTLYVKVS